MTRTLTLVLAACGLCVTAPAFGQAVPTAPTAAAPVGPAPAPAAASPAAPVAPVVVPPVPVPAPAACVAPTVPDLGFELWGDGIDNDCDGKVDERNSAAQLKAKAEELVTAQCTCAPATVDGKRAVELGVKMLRSAEAYGLVLTDVKFADADCDAAADIGPFAWVGWAYMDPAGMASYASGARAEAKKANEGVAALDVRTTALEAGVAELNEVVSDHIARLSDAETRLDDHDVAIEELSTTVQNQGDLLLAHDKVILGHSRQLGYVLDDLYNQDSDGDGVYEDQGLLTEVYGDGGSADDSRIDQVEEDIARLDVDHNTLAVVVGGGFQTSEVTVDGTVLKSDSFGMFGLSYSIFGAPFQSAPGFSLGLDTVAGFIPSQRGFVLAPSAMAGFGGDRVRIYGLVGAWLENAAQTGRKSGVTSYGADIGARADWLVTEGVVLQARVLQSIYGLDSVRDGTEQCVYDAGLTMVMGGAGFSF